MFEVLTLEGSVAARDHLGGTAPGQVGRRSPGPASGWRSPKPWTAWTTSTPASCASPGSGTGSSSTRPRTWSWPWRGRWAKLTEHFQWLSEAQSANLGPDQRERVGEELADCLIYLIRLGERLGIDPIAAAYRKIAINERRYPVERVRGNARRAAEYGD